MADWLLVASFFLSFFLSLDASLSADGNIVAVGAYGHDGLRGTDSGEAKVYAYNNVTQLWDLRGSLIDGEAAGDISGAAVILSDNGHVVGVGAPLNDNRESR